MKSDPQNACVVIQNMAGHQEIPEDGILTRTIFDREHLKAVLFTFSPDQELSEHTASMPAVLHFLAGTARVRLGDETIDAEAGTWVHMPAGMPHSIRTHTPVTMLLLLIKCSSGGG